MSFITDHGSYCTIAIRVTPRASRTKIGEVKNDRLKISLTAPPVENAANQALIEFIADLLSIPKRQVSIQNGELSRDKVVRVDAVPYPKLCAALRSAQG